MTVFVYFLVPETQGVPLEEVYTLYAKHKVWGKVVGDAAAAVLELEATRTASREFSLTEAGQFQAKAEDQGVGNDGEGGGAPQ